MKTEFATPERAGQEQLTSEIRHTRQLPMVKELTNLISDAFVILNRHRQIVYCNQLLLDILNLKTPQDIYGKRLGEAFSCIHADKSEGGCGTTAFCSICGAAVAIQKSQLEIDTLKQEECRLTAKDNDLSFDFLIRTKTLALEGDLYTLVIVRDIGEKKRKQVLERIFFHDLINTAGGLKGLIELMEDADNDEMEEFIQLAQNSSEILIEEINAQKDLLAAENNSLDIEYVSLNSMGIINSVLAIYKNHHVAGGKKIQIDQNAVSMHFMCDPRLLIRVVGNMAKNALEAEPTGSRITIGATQIKEEIRFWVHNPSSMAEKIKMQVFQRSFSTKGSGRGLGTYSIKLLGEKFLKGRVSFSTSKADGTQFWIQLPVQKQVSNS